MINSKSSWMLLAALALTPALAVGCGDDDGATGGGGGGAGGGGTAAGGGDGGAAGGGDGGATGGGGGGTAGGGGGIVPVCVPEDGGTAVCNQGATTEPDGGATTCGLRCENGGICGATVECPCGTSCEFSCQGQNCQDTTFDCETNENDSCVLTCPGGANGCSGVVILCADGADCSCEGNCTNVTFGNAADGGTP